MWRSSLTLLYVLLTDGRIQEHETETKLYYLSVINHKKKGTSTTIIYTAVGREQQEMLEETIEKKTN